MSKKDQQRINAVENDFIRQGCRVFTLEHTEIRDRMGTQRMIANEIEKRGRIWHRNVQKSKIK